MSCDGGQTWINDRSANDNARCWTDSSPNNVECDHSPYAASQTSGDYSSDGYFYAAFGWGYDGEIRKTRDGVNWTVIRNDNNGGGVAASATSVVTLIENWQYSSNQGQTWQNANINGLNIYNDIDHPMPFRVGSTFFAVGREGAPVGIMWSADGGRSWQRGSGFSSGNNFSMASGNGVIVANGYGNTISRSTDGGLTWQTRTVAGPDGWGSHILFTGTQFVVWSRDNKFTSTDGLNWTMSSSNRPWSEAAVSYDPVAKVYVAISRAWGDWYANQHAYRSVDGNTWTTLSSTAFKGGHPINKIVLGEMDRSACP